MLRTSVIRPDIQDSHFTNGFGVRIHEENGANLTPIVAVDLLRGKERNLMQDLLEEYGFYTLNVGDRSNYMRNKLPWESHRGRRDPFTRMLHQDSAALYCPSWVPPWMSETIMAPKTKGLHAIIDNLQLTGLPWWHHAHIKNARNALQKILAEGKEYEEVDAVREQRSNMALSVDSASWFSRNRFFAKCNRQLSKRSVLHCHQWARGDILGFSDKHILHASLPRIFSGRLLIMGEPPLTKESA